MSTDASDLIARLRAETASWGRLPAAMRFKRALVERVGVDAAFAIASPALGVPGIQVLRRRTIRPLGATARDRGLAYRQLWPGGEEHALPLPRVVGAGNHRPITVTDRAAYLACLDEVLVRGYSDLLLRGSDEALLDFERDEYSRVPDHPEYDPAILAANAAAAWTMEPATDAEVPRVAEALSLCGAHAMGFGHWLAEYLPKLAVARLAGWRGGMPVLVDRNIPASVRAALPGLLPSDAPLIDVAPLAPLRVGRLWCVANPAYAGFYPTALTLADTGRMLVAPRRLACLLDELGALTDAATARPTGLARVYLDRQPQRRKRLLDAPAVRAVLAARGFYCIYPEDLTLPEQWRLVRHARHLVAPEGSNSLLALWAARGAKACILGSPYTHRITDVSATLALRGIEPLHFTGPYATESPGYKDDEFWSFWNDYRIDVAAFGTFLDDWLAAAGTRDG